MPFGLPYPSHPGGFWGYKKGSGPKDSSVPWLAGEEAVSLGHTQCPQCFLQQNFFVSLFFCPFEANFVHGLSVRFFFLKYGRRCLSSMGFVWTSRRWLCHLTHGERLLRPSGLSCQLWRVSPFCTQREGRAPMDTAWKLMAQARSSCKCEYAEAYVFQLQVSNLPSLVSIGPSGCSVRKAVNWKWLSHIESSIVSVSTSCHGKNKWEWGSAEEGKYVTMRGEKSRVLGRKIKGLKFVIYFLCF